MTSCLTDIFNRLLDRFGPQGWWPAATPFETVVGAILTQNTNWKNVERAIANLREADALDSNGMAELSPAELEALIRPSGYFRQKAARLSSFVDFLANDHQGSLEVLFNREPEALRETLLGRPGIGPETADSIMLYAAGKASFVVDAYTHRILERLGVEQPGTPYETTRQMFMQNLPADPGLFNEYHALLVRLAKEHCTKRNPTCPDCPLTEICPAAELPSGD